MQVIAGKPLKMGWREEAAFTHASRHRIRVGSNLASIGHFELTGYACKRGSQPLALAVLIFIENAKDEPCIAAHLFFKGKRQEQRKGDKTACLGHG